MNIKFLTYVGLAALLQLVPAVSAATISATSSVTAAGALYNYSYQFTVSGTSAGVNALFLSSGDLSPLNLTFSNSAWTWADATAYSTNGIELYNPTGSLSSGTLSVSFTSYLASQPTHFAVGLDTTGTVTNTVTSLAGPTAAPEPGTLAALSLGFAGLGLWQMLGRRRAA